MFNTVKYHGIEGWPSVEALTVDYGGEVNSNAIQTRWGQSSNSFDSRWVKYEYLVNGILYRGNKAGADTKDHPREILNAPVKVFYKPTDPQTSVLAPYKFRGDTLLFIAALLGCAAAVHLWCFFADLRDKKLRKG